MLSIQNLKANLTALITNSDKVLILPHLQADFDAIAASLGIALISDELKVKNHIIIGDPIKKLDLGVQKMIEQVKDDHSIIDLEQFKKERTKNSLDVMCDVSKAELTCINDYNKDKLVVIDHHNKDDKTITSCLEHIDTDASSASEIVTALLEEYKIDIPKDIANILMAGMLLDTKKLLNGHASKETLLKAAYLYDFGATLADGDSYFMENRKNKKKFQVGMLLGKDDEIYTKEELAKAANALIDKNLETAYVIGNTEDGKVSISARSKNTINVGNIMRELNGGGTPCSGATKLENTTVESAGKKLLKVIYPNFLRQKLKKY